MMCSPSNESGPHSYAVIPCSENSQEHLPPHNSAPTGNVQYISNVPNVHVASPIMNPPTSSPQWSAAITMPQKTPTSVMQKTKGLVILLIVACVAQFILGIGMLFTLYMHYTLYSGVPFWGLVSYFVAAGLTLSAQNTTSPCVVKGSLALNILSAIISGLGIIMACLDIVAVSLGCPLHDSAYYLCQGKHIGAIVVYTLLIVTNLILVCVSVFLAAYGCRHLDTTPSAPQVYLVQNMVTPASTAVIPAPPMACTQTSPSCDIPVEDRR